MKACHIRLRLSILLSGKWKVGNSTVKTSLLKQCAIGSLHMLIKRLHARYPTSASQSAGLCTNMLRTLQGQTSLLKMLFLTCAHLIVNLYPNHQSMYPIPHQGGGAPYSVPPTGTHVRLMSILRLIRPPGVSGTSTLPRFLSESSSSS